jgi:hypothetical protein
MKMERQIIFQNSEHPFKKWGFLFIYFICLQYSFKIEAQTLGDSCPTNGVIAAPVANGNSYLCTSGTWGPTLLFSTGTYVGIGTTSPSRSLHVAGAAGLSAKIAISGDTTGNAGAIDFIDSGSNKFWQVVRRATDHPTEPDRFEIHYTPNGSNFHRYMSFYPNEVADGSGGDANFGGKLTIDGNVGIGTTTPGNKLEVAGTIKSSSGGFLFPDGSVQISSATNSASQWITTGSNIYYNNGFVGLGTNAPSSLLHLTSNNSGGTALRLENTDTGGRSFKIWSTGSMAASGTGRLEIYDTTANASRMLINAIGNVGIGVTNPTNKLVVSGTIQSSTGGFMFPDGTVQISSATGGASQWTTTSGTNIYYNNGNVGIGTLTPTVNLDVVGEIKVGNLSTTCATAIEGAIRYKASSKKMEFCNGITWGEIGNSVPPPYFSLGASIISLGTISNGASPGNCIDVTVSNTGTTQATGLATSFTGGDNNNFETCTPSSNACGALLSASTSCKIGIRVKATNSGSYTTTLSVANSEGGSGMATVNGEAYGFGTFSSANGGTLDLANKRIKWTTAGTYSITLGPTERFIVEANGAGGPSTGDGGGSGGGGAYVRKTFVTASSVTYTVIVGDYIKKSDGSNWVNDQEAFAKGSSFVGGSINAVAGGGQGAIGQRLFINSTASGGTASGGDINTNGSNGMVGVGNTCGCSGTSILGGNSGGPYFDGTNSGIGGAGGAYASSANSGNAPGGGAGGAGDNGSGAYGGNGQVRITIY